MKDDVDDLVGAVGVLGVVAAQPGFEVLRLLRYNIGRGKVWQVCSPEPVVAWKVSGRGCEPVTIALSDDTETKIGFVKYPNGEVQSLSLCGDRHESVEAALAEMNVEVERCMAAGAFVDERYAGVVGEFERSRLRYWNQEWWRRVGDDWLRVRRKELQGEILEWLNKGSVRGPDDLLKFDIKGNARRVYWILQDWCRVESWAGGPVDCEEGEWEGWGEPGWEPRDGECVDFEVGGVSWHLHRSVGAAWLQNQKATAGPRLVAERSEAEGEHV